MNLDLFWVSRNSPRDIWKIKNWEVYNAGVNYSIPATLNDRTVTDEFFVVNNNSREELMTSITALTAAVMVIGLFVALPVWLADLTTWRSLERSDSRS